MARPTFTMSIDVKLLIERLLKLQVGEEVTYAELSTLLSRDIQKDARGALQTAIKRARRDHQIVIGTLWGEGVQRLADTDIVSSSAATLKRVQRAARRGIEVLSCVDYDALPEKARRDHNTRMTVLATVATFASPPALRRLEEIVAQQGRVLPLAETIKHFGG